VFGPLPRIHKVALAAAAVVFFVAVGAWVAHRTPLPLVAPWGSVFGALLGAAVAYLLVHDSHQRREPGRRTVRHH
jgi:uncharacterized membrane protein YfcA